MSLVTMRPRSGAPTPSRGLGPTLALGFRPFFLLAAGYAALIVPLWVAALHGGLGMDTALPPTLWHAHELLFGYAAAVIAGFLLTAVRNWTGGQRTPEGAGLAALCGLWLAGRLTAALPHLELAAAVNLAFLPALAFGIGVPLIRARNRRNYKVLAVVLALWVTQLLLFGAALGVPWLLGWGRVAVHAALAVVVVLCLLIAGRIVPMFTRNATGVQSIGSAPWLDRIAVGAAVATAALLATPGLPPWVAGVAATAAGLATFGRMVPWGTRHTLRTPLLWVLHLGHAWIGLGLLLLGAERLGWGVTAAASSAHALAVGGIGLLTLGMMARVSLGHTGRPLEPRWLSTVAFALLALAALARALAPLAVPSGAYPAALYASGALWTVSFALFLLEYTPILTAPRPDGRPG